MAVFRTDKMSSTGVDKSSTRRAQNDKNKRRSSAKKPFGLWIKVGVLVLCVTGIAVTGYSLLNNSKAAGASPDINSDGTVNALDLSMLLSNWNTSAGSSDINGDGTVNVFDLSALLSQWGTVTGPVKPSATNTGVPAGRTLTVPITDTIKGISVASNGNVTITKGGVFQDMLIKGRLTVRADNVTIRYSRIEANPTPWDLPNEPTSQAECSAFGNPAVQAVSFLSNNNLLIEDSEILAVRKSSFIANGIHGSQYTLRRVDISGTVDGAGIYNTGAANVLIESSYLHDFYTGAYSFGHGCDEPTHTDGVQIHYGNTMTIRNNTINASTNIPYSANAGIMINQNGGLRTSNVTVDGNWMDYGNCSINVWDNGLGAIQGLRLTNNKFGKNQKLRGAGLPCAMIVETNTKNLGTNVFSGNVWQDNSTPLPPVLDAGT